MPHTKGMTSIPIWTALALLACNCTGCVAIDPCENTVVNESLAPGGKTKAIVFERSCGATTGFSTQVSIMKAADDSTNTATWTRSSQRGNAFVADTDHGRAPSERWGGPRVHVEWLSATHLRIVHDQSTRVFTAAKRVSDVTIDYSALPPNTPLQPTSAAGK
jgi:hypothetical protein